MLNFPPRKRAQEECPALAATRARQSELNLCSFLVFRSRDRVYPDDVDFKISRDTRVLLKPVAIRSVDSSANLSNSSC